MSTSEAPRISRDDPSVNEQAPLFEKPGNFQKSPGKEGYWFCIACKPFPHTGVHTYNATAALKHERSQAHKNSLKTTGWGIDPVDTWAGKWGSDSGPYEMLRSDTTREEVPMGRRVKHWMKEMARAERGEDMEEEEDEEEDEPPIADTWDDWGSARNDWGSGADDDWMSRKPWDECMPLNKKGAYPAERPPLSGEVDPQAAADFQFVEKVAKARGLTKESRRLHYFFRLPTEEKINRIHEIVQFISCH